MKDKFILIRLKEFLKIKKDKPISKRLKDFLHEYEIVIPLFAKDIDNLTEHKLEDFLGSRKPCSNYFHLECEDGIWYVDYGWDKEGECMDRTFNNYSEALEEGTIEFIKSLYDIDENGEYIGFFIE